MKILKITPPFAMLIFLFAAFLLLFTGNMLPANTPASQTLPFTGGGFIENKGQFINDMGRPANDLLFKARSGGVEICITNRGISYIFNKIACEEAGNGLPGKKVKSSSRSWVNMVLESARIRKENIKMLLPEEGYSNYFLAHCPQGITNVMTYDKILVEEVYPGIDWVIYKDPAKGYKYDFIVHPGADAASIHARYEGVCRALHSDGGQSLRISTALGEVTEGKLYSYEEKSLRPVGSAYSVNNSNEVTFRVAGYDRTQSLVIDPPMGWSTYYGSNSSVDDISQVVTDASSNMYALGYTISNTFPTQTLAGAYNQAFGGNGELAVLKFNSAGTRLWVTFFGGSSLEYSFGASVDAASGNLYVTGYTQSSDFPRVTLGGGAYNQSSPTSLTDAFISRFNASGALTWSTFYGGNDVDYGHDIGIDVSGNFYITGETQSTNFPCLTYTPATAGQYNQSIKATTGGQDAFILKFDNGCVRKWATYYGGAGVASNSGWGATADPAGNIYIAGVTNSTSFPTLTYTPATAGQYNQSTMGFGGSAFLLKFSSAGVRQWSTYYGSGARSKDAVTDPSGNLYVVGLTQSASFPYLAYSPVTAGQYNQSTLAGGQNAFILKFNSSGTRQWSTYYGGESWDDAQQIVVEGSGTIYITGSTYSTAFPILSQAGSYNQSVNASAPSGGTTDDFYVLQINSAGVREWATYLGGNDDEKAFDTGFLYGIAVDGGSCVYVTGATSSSDFPLQTLSGGYNQAFGGVQTGFITKFCTAILPLEMLSFKGESKSGFNLLEWTTASEKNNDYFVLERSADGELFEPVGRVKGAGSSSEKHYYAMRDDAPFYPVTYYRLRQNDYDGNYSYTAVITVSAPFEEYAVICPNPAREAAFLLWRSESDAIVNVCIEDLPGNHISRQVLHLHNGENRLRLDVKDLPPGMYILQTEGLGGKQRLKFIKQ